MNQRRTKATPTAEGQCFDEEVVEFNAIATATLAARDATDRSTSLSPAFCAERCPDQWVGTVRLHNARLSYIAGETESAQEFAFRRPTSELAPNGRRRLLMILESPHIREFAAVDRIDRESQGAAPSGGRAVGPAAGATGACIRTLLGEIALIGAEPLTASAEGEELDLVLINAIQHQTSLGHATHRFRDAVFRRAWGSKQLGRPHLQSRLDALWRAEPQDIVMNCCTGSERSKTSLKHLVYDALREVADVNPQRQSLVIGCAHPSSWWRSENNRRARVAMLGPRAGSSEGGAHV